MATSTFDKEIYIDEKAADIMIKIFDKPIVKPPDVGDIFERSAEALKWLLSGSEKSSTLHKN